MWIHGSRILIVSAIVAALPALATADELVTDLEQVLIESAETAKEHAALSSHFRTKGESMRKEAERHRQMGRSYGGQDKINRRTELQSHCDALAKLHEDMAEQYDALAAFHAAEAER